MRPCLAFVLASTLLLAAGPASAVSGEVLVMGTSDGAVIRIPDARAEDCVIVKSEPPRFVVDVSNVDLRSRVVPNNTSWVRSIRVIGADALGAGQSRIMIETASTLIDLHVEAAAPSGAALVLTGDFSMPSYTGEGDVAEPETEPEPEAAPAPATPEPKPAKKEKPPKAEKSSSSKTPPPSAPSSPPPSSQQQAATPAAVVPPAEGAQPWHDDGSGMVVIAGGEFVMGSVEGASFADESPEHPVLLRGYRIDAREVTVAEFAASPLSMPKQPEWSQDPANPVVNVTWHEAAEYCEWREKRLPTEAEWERAARGTDRRTYPWGSAWSPTRANTGLDGDGFAYLAPGGSLGDGTGAVDLSGNAWEWTADWYGKDTYGERSNVHPGGPPRGSHKVARGGSFRSSSATTATTTVRLPLPPSTRRDDVGFRCASSD